MAQQEIPVLQGLLVRLVYKDQSVQRVFKVLKDLQEPQDQLELKDL